MKQGAALTKFIFLMLLLALIAYGACAAVSTLEKTVTTVTAIACEVGDGFQATGFVVRDETVLRGNGGISILLRDEGERVAKGEALAATYADADAQEVQQRVNALEQELSRYEAVLGVTPNGKDSVTLDAQVRQSLLRFSVQTARGNLKTATASNELKALVLRRFLSESSRYSIQSQAQETRSELAALRTKLSGGVTQYTAQSAGFFSGGADGYETLLTPENIMTISPADFNRIAQAKPTTPTTAIGRLITDAQWYYVCTVAEDKLTGCTVGSVMQVDLGLGTPLSMQVERISAAMEGQKVLVLSCDDDMSQIARLRTQAADVALHSYSGLRVPKRAIYYNNETNAAGVYVLEGAVAKWKSVELIYESADYFLVRLDKSNTANLWPGDELILATGEITNGKVVG